MLDIRNALLQGTKLFEDGGIGAPRLTAEVLLAYALHRDRTYLYSHPEQELTEIEWLHYGRYLHERLNGKPTQYITRTQDFYGRPFYVTPDVLIPRPETEHVVEVALDRLAVREIRAGRKQTLSGDGLNIIDVGTGSGCIGIALAKELPGAHIVATDISEAALAVARRNAARHAFSNGIRFVQCNLLNHGELSNVEASVVGAQHAAPLPGKVLTGSVSSGLFDLIVSNPPYIGRKKKETLMREVRDHEPELALYGGEEGYELYADLIAQAARSVVPGGLLVLELGHNSLPAVQPLLDLPNWSNVAVTKDLAGIDRVIAAERG